MFENDTGLLLIIGMIVAFEVGAIVLGAVNLEKCPAEPALPVWLIVRERRNTRSLPPRSVYLIFYTCLPAPSTSPSRCCCVDDYGHTCKRSWLRKYRDAGCQHTIASIPHHSYPPPPPPLFPTSHQIAGMLPLVYFISDKVITTFGCHTSSSDEACDIIMRTIMVSFIFL